MADHYNLPPVALSDLETIKNALQDYHDENSTYPANKDFIGLHYNYSGDNENAWIEGLVPKYLPALPRDPAGKGTGRQEYLYRSDGNDYKLICTRPSQMDIYAVMILHPELMDPRRPRCFGFWTEKATDW
jgi:hypothetical protein